VEEYSDFDEAYAEYKILLATPQAF
jgi:hypothetical protein